MAEEEDDQKPNIIIDNGSGYFKAGLSGEEKPKSVFPSIVGYPNYMINSGGSNYSNTEDCFVGTDAEANSYKLNLNYPIEHGIINDWEDMKEIYSHIFKNELRVEPAEFNVFLTEPLMNPKQNREKIAQIMFETFKVSGLSFESQPLLCLYAGGKFTGFVVDSGEGLTQFAPFYDGFPLSHAMKKIDLSGGIITNYMLKLLNNNGLNFSNHEKEKVRNIKEKACYVALDFNNFKDSIKKSIEPFYYELPDGNQIVLKEQRIICTEGLFKPSIIGKSGNGLAKTCYDLIQKCNIDIKKDLYNCIFLSGGNTMFKGFPERFEKEIKGLVPESMKEEVKAIASPERKIHVWIGGSIISSISTYESKWATKKDYEEKGMKIIQ